MIDNENKFWIITITFFLIYSVFGSLNYFEYGKVNNSQDFVFHFGKANGTIKDSNYPPLYHLLFSAFSFNELFFYEMNLILIVFVLPFLLFKATKSLWTPIIYFFGIGLPHSLIYGATYPQVLILLMFAYYLINRFNYKLLILFIVLGMLIHKEGGIFFIIVLLTEIFALVFETTRRNILLKKQLQQISFSGFLFGARLNNFNGVFLFFTSIIPVPILFLGMKRIYYDLFLLLMVGISLISAVMFDIRTLSIMQVILVILASDSIEEIKNKKIKLGLIIFFLVQLAYYLIDFMTATRSLMFY